jgi:hypothetical protein
LIKIALALSNPLSITGINIKLAIREGQHQFFQFFPSICREQSPC